MNGVASRRSNPLGASRQFLPAVAGLALAALAISSYHAIGQAYYAGYWVPQGFGMTSLLPQEMAHLGWFTVFGLVALVALAAALSGLDAIDGVRRVVEALAARPPLLVGTVMGMVTLCGVAVGHALLAGAVLTDDESAYRFIAQTLRTGALVAPSPGTHLDFFREQFVVLTDTVRFGKYPIGHPLLLALGQALGLESLVVPTVTAALAVPLWVLGRRAFDATTAALGLLLFATSPQVLLSAATLLSQPASALCMTGACACLLTADRRGRAALAAAGTLLGYGVLVRPLPGVLFVAAALAWFAWSRRGGARPAGLLDWMALGAPLAAACAVLLAVNRAQTGGALQTGYQEFHQTGQGLSGLAAFFSGSLATYAMSVASAVVRISAWQTGWPLAAGLALAAGWSRERALLWAMVVAALAYRVLSPKAGVAATGPVYMLEVVPLLCLLSAAGLVRLLRDGRIPRGRRGATALLLSGAAVCMSMFLPVKVEALGRMARAQRVLPETLAQRNVHRALVFHDAVVPLPAGLTWAYYPRFNSPRLDDDVLFLRLGSSALLPEAFDLWRTRYPDREAWFFGYREGRPVLVPLAEYARDPWATPVGPLALGVR